MLIKYVQLKTEISGKDILCSVHNDSKTTWEVKEALIKFSSSLILQLHMYNVLRLHKVEAHNSNPAITLAINETGSLN